MDYQELKDFATRLNVECTETPLNALELVKRLNIPHGDENDANADFKGADNPLWEYPACLYIDEYGKRKIYYNSKTRFWNFYLMHEVAHWLLCHMEKSYCHEMEADLLACILIMPLENIKKRIINGHHLHQICNIPIDRADFYYSEIYKELNSNKK